MRRFISSRFRRWALAQAVEADVDGLPARVITAEHLAAIALQTRRPKDKTRLLQFIDEGILESKAALRRELGSQSIADKLRMLGRLRERQLAIEPAKKRLRGEKANARERR